jgi:hypothetical protein
VIDLAQNVRDFAPAGLGWAGPLVLTPVEVNRVPSGMAGVYLLHHFAATLGGYPVFYAGKSRDLRRRLAEHLSDRKSKASIWWLCRDGRAYFSAAPIADLALLDHIEAGLIAGLQPPCNDQLPTVTPVFVNLPPLRL